MQSSSIPAKFPIPWANSAGAGFIRPVPTASQIGIQNGAASLTDGYPPLNFLQVASGGVPPFGQDTNGILNQITAWEQWVQAGGGIVPYDATFQTEIGGYPSGAYVTSAITPGLIWRCTVNNNMTNPDTGGAGWVYFFPGGNIAVYKIIGGVQQVSINGAAFTTTGATSFAAVPLRVKVRIWGAGGGSGGCSGAGSGGGAGGGGEYAEGIFAVTSTQTITVGAPGTAGASTPTAGGAGGTSAFGALITAGGGLGGGAQLGSGSGGAGAGGTGGSGGSFRVPGQAGSLSFPIGSLQYAALGGASFGCGMNSPIIGAVAVAGFPGQFPGQGSTGPILASFGAIGASGIIIAEW